jgi:cell wall-associated NlpC family hydrolase
MAMPMDIITFDWNKNAVPDHIGFVRARKSDMEIYTIEGNMGNSICANRTRNTKYVQAVFRPHFKASYKIGTLEVDGLMGYNTIAMLQTALKAKGTYSGAVDGILGKGTVKGIQKLCGVTADGLWGKGTSKAVQSKLCGVTADGLFGVNSVKALQRWINAVTKSTPSTSWVDNANAWARKIASEKYHYVRWKSDDAKTKTCPVCNGRKYDDHYGWNCIGFAYAVWHHGGQLGTTCNCGVINNGTAEKLLKVSQAEANKLATSKIGKSVTVIRNGGKAIPMATLKAGDICMLYKGSTYYHTIYYMGNGKFAESNTTGGIGNAKNIRADLTLSSSFKSKLKLAIRYNGK